MARLLHKLLSICLAAALSVVPLPAFASAVTASGCDHGSMSTAMEKKVEQQKPGCKHCQAQHCEDGSCNQPDCSSCFNNLISAPVFTSVSRISGEQPLPMTAAGLLSYGEPPPLRPPL